MQSGLSTNEKDFLLTALRAKQRVDGRALFQCRRTKFTFDRSDNECQAEVQFGRTRVLCVVSATVAQPYDDSPTEGFVNIFVSLSPMADAAFANSKLSSYTLEIRSALEGLLKDGNAMDFEALCIVAGEKVWSIRIDVCVLDNAGNLIDASASAMMAALLYFRKAAIEIDDGGEIRLLPAHESEPTPLSIHHVPLSSTLLIFNGGESALLDPTEREEMVIPSRICYSFNTHKEICMLQKLGGMAVSPGAMLRFARLAFVNVEGRIKQLTEAVDKALVAADQRRWTVRTATMADLPENSIFKQPQGHTDASVAVSGSPSRQPFAQPELSPELKNLVSTKNQSEQSRP